MIEIDTPFGEFRYAVEQGNLIGRTADFFDLTEEHQGNHQPVFGASRRNLVGQVGEPGLRYRG